MEELKYFKGHELTEIEKKFDHLTVETIVKYVQVVQCDAIPFIDERIFNKHINGDTYIFIENNEKEISEEEAEKLKQEGKEVTRVDAMYGQFYFVNENSVDALIEADEILFYSNMFNCYVWAVPIWHI